LIEDAKIVDHLIKLSKNNTFTYEATQNKTGKSYNGYIIRVCNLLNE